MPTYLYKHPKTEEVVEIIQSMKEKHEYIDGNGIKWIRIWTVPQSNVDTKLDPHSEKDFIRYTGARKGTLGDLQDLSEAMSKERAAKNGGIDMVREKYYDQQEKNTGIKSFERKKREANKRLEKIAPGVSIE